MTRVFAQRILPVLIVLGASVAGWAQMGPPKPGPELKKLDYFLGSWTAEATIPPGPWGPGGKMTSSTTNEWMEGGFFMVGQAEATLPPELGGAGKRTAYTGYDTTNNVYTVDGFSSQGRHESATGTVTGDTWTWSSEANYGGQNVKQRLTLKMVSPTSYTMKFEVSMDGTNWMTFFDGKATKK